MFKAQIIKKYVQWSHMCHTFAFQNVKDVTVFSIKKM